MDYFSLVFDKVSTSMEVYKRWVTRNKDYIHIFEHIVNRSTWLLPERFSESEVGAEAVTAILGMISAINDHIITSASLEELELEPGEAQSSFPYSLCITLLKNVESVVEVVAQQYTGDDKKWNFIAITEAIKVLIRLVVFRDSGYKLLLQGGEIENVESENRELDLQETGVNGSNNPWNLERIAISALSEFGRNSRISSEPSWVGRVRHQRTLMEPHSQVETQTLSASMSKLFMVGEVMTIIRPLIYVILARKYGLGSWLPWCVSLAVDLTGFGIISRVLRPQDGMIKPPFGISIPEKNELRRRKILWALYLMRDPFFSKYTKQRLQSIVRVVGNIPIVDVLTERGMELILGAQTLYNYTSGS